MFNNVNDYPFLNQLIANKSIILDELNTALVNNKLIHQLFYPNDSNLEYYTDFWVKDNGFHIDQTGYDIRKGEYATVAIYKKEFPIKWFEVKDHFPNTLGLIQSIPGLYYAAFFKMYSQTNIASHTHSRKHLIFHLLLNDLQNGDFILRCGNESKTLKKAGDNLLFDYSLEHESSNRSETDRIHFIIDFNPYYKL